MEPFCFKDHTADIAMAVTGATIEELFTHAAEGLSTQLFSAPEKLTGYKTARKKIELAAPGREDLFIDWLNELIYLFYSEGFLFKSAEFADLQNTNLICRVEGYTIPRKDRVYAKEIKAATYHDLRIEERPGMFQVEVVLDI